MAKHSAISSYSTRGARADPVGAPMSTPSALANASITTVRLRHLRTALTM